MDFQQAKQFYDQLRQDLYQITQQANNQRLISTSNITSDLQRIQRGLYQLQQRSNNPHIPQQDKQYFSEIPAQMNTIGQLFQKLQQNPQDMKNFTDTVNDGLNNMKTELKKVSKNLADGVQIEDRLGNVVNEAKDESNFALKKTNRAGKFIKKNKDWCFLGIAVLQFVILTIMFIF